MAASDGNTVWPPRSSDLRIQELTGAGPEGSTPDHVRAVFIAAGYTGTLDDMWQQHLAALGITDTSEPFTDTIAISGAVEDADFANVELLLRFYGADAATTLTEESSNAHGVTFGGNAALETDETKWGSSSLYLLDQTDTITIPNDASLNFHTATSFTVEFWYKTADTNTTCGLSISKGAALNYNFELNNGGTFGSLKWQGVGATRNYNMLISEVNAGTWNHAAFMWNGTTVSAYNNGLRLDLDNDPNTGWQDETSDLIIKPVASLTSVPIYVDSIRITRNVLRYDNTGTPFAVPTQTFGTVAP